MPARAALAAWFAVSLLAAGCGGSSKPAGPSYGSTEGQKIAVFVEKVNDDKGVYARLKQLLASDVNLSAAEQKKIWTIAYEVKGEPTVTGDTATAKVAMRSESISSADLGEKEWTFVKEKDAWKIKTCPLP
jgi:hypothetical protein